MLISLLLSCCCAAAVLLLSLLPSLLLPLLLPLLLLCELIVLIADWVQDTDRLEYVVPKRTTLKHRLPMADAGFIQFLTSLLQVDPDKRPTATEALNHPWLSHRYEKGANEEEE